LRFISQDTYKGVLWDTQSLNLYNYVQNAPINLTDPSGHMSVEKLRTYSAFLNSGMVSNESLFVQAVLMENKNNIYLGFHEIAQLYVGKELSDSGFVPTLEQSITSTTQKNIFGRYKTYEADVVVESTRQVWEVKPINGKDPRKQLELYKTEGNYKLGEKLDTIEDIPIVGSLKMKVEFPSEGTAIYSFYKKDNNGKPVPVASTEAKKEVEEYFKALNDSINGEEPWWKQLFPKIFIPGLGEVPALEF
jgi:hypothetical protein